VTGPLALHGGGEFLPGDEPFLRRLLAISVERAVSRRAGEAADAAEEGAAKGASPDGLEIEVVTTALARHRPALAFAFGSAVLERLAAEGPMPARVRHAEVVEAASAADMSIAVRLAAADLVYLPGGDPDAVVEILARTPALRGIETARARGGVVAGASAGAMAFGAMLWTREGIVPGFGWAGPIVVVPHATAQRTFAMRGHLATVAGGQGLGVLGLAERAGVIGEPGSWEVVGAGGAWWLGPKDQAPARLEDGETLRP
jgi:hypothetical protein